MSDRAIPELPQAAQLQASDELLLWQGTLTCRVRLDRLAAYLGTSIEDEEPPSTLPSATHWRVRRLASANTSFVGIAELELGTPATGGTVLYSSQYDASSFAAARAFDGDPATAWATSGGAVSNAFVGYAWPDQIEVPSVSITASTGTTAATYTPTEIALEYSDDGTNWTTDYTATKPSAWEPGETYTFPRPA